MARARIKSDYRMDPRSLNLLLAKLRCEYKQMLVYEKDRKSEAIDSHPISERKIEIGSKAMLSSVSEGSVELKNTGHGLDIHVEFFTIKKEFPKTEKQEIFSQKKYTVFNVTKDSQNKEVESQLGFIGDVIQAFRRQHPEEKDSTLLLPLRQCRGFAKLPIKLLPDAKREHIILVELSPDGRLLTHDSQSKIRYKLYPDRLIDLAKVIAKSYEYNAYGTQKDEYECGFFVYNFINTILTTGDSRQCAAIKIDETYVQKTQAHIVELFKEEQAEMDKQLGQLDI